MAVRVLSQSYGVSACNQVCLKTPTYLIISVHVSDSVLNFLYLEPVPVPN